LPRRQSTTTSLLGAPLEIADAASFLWTIPDVIERGIHAFPSSSPAPVIIDGGANVGLASLFFKQLYPASHIDAFEPDPVVYGMLRRNLAAWGYPDVVCHCSALWSSEGGADFWTEGADAGRIVQGCDARNTRIHTVRLSSYITGPIDMLKLDIEGAEVEVLTECADRLHLVRCLYVGYHSFRDRPQQLDVLFALLKSAGFRVYIDAGKREPRPLVSRDDYLDMDAQFSVFGYRP
jgi:FkbM family methyltransferase